MDSLIFELQIVFYFQLFLSANVRHKYKPPKIITQKKPLLNHPSKYKPPGGLVLLEFALEYKVKQSKNGKFPSPYKLAQSNLKCKFPSIHKPLQK